MNSVVTLLVIVIVALIGYFIPKKFDDYFQSEYHENIISMPLAVATAIFSSLWLLFMDVEGIWYWFLMIGAIALLAVSIARAIFVGVSVQAGVLEIVFAVILQTVATVGVIILILGVIALIMGLFGNKRRKRK